MNFLKKTANKLSNGIELESLKYERGNLKNQIRSIESKITTYNQTLELKTHLQMLIDALTNSIEKPIIIAGATTSTPEEGKTKKRTEDDDSDDGVEEEEDPDSFENIQKKTYNTIKSSNDDVQKIVEKLNIILAPGIDKHNSEIQKKRQRIEEINKRLSTLRAKK